MEIKMIVTDLDKSLLNNDYQITEYTKKVFLECMEKGIIVVFATTRPLRATKIYYNSILPHAIICHNGAVAYTNEKQIYQCGIDPLMTKKLLEKLMKNYPNVNIAVESNDQVYANFDLTRIWPEVIFKDLDLKKMPETETDKIIIKMETIEKIIEMKKYLSEKLYLEINKEKLGLIMNKGATKWKALKKILEYYKMSARNVVAFGDDTNDLEMIKNCGKGICVKNGLEDVKKIANEICEDNEKDGIAKWIEENILNGK